MKVDPMAESINPPNHIEEKTLELMKTLEEFRQSEQRYHKMIAEIQDYAIILLDKEGIIQNWNKGAEKIKQYKEKEVVGRSFHIFYLPQDRNTGLPEKLIKEAVETGHATHEGWRIRKDQTRFWGSITITALRGDNNEIIGFSKVTRDLTERKTVEDQLRSFAAELQQRNDALRESEERYHQMIAEVQDYAIILLNTKGDIQNWNAGAEHIKGYRAEEVIGKNFRIFYTPESIESKLPEKLLEQARQTGKATQEGWRLRKDGSRFWSSVVITALHDKNQQVIGYSKVTRDLTEKKIAEDKLRDYTLELELQNKELEQFAYVASHDLQEPLRKIMTFSEMVQKQPHSDDTVKRYVDKISSSAQRMNDLIKSVLNYSRLLRNEDQVTFADLNLILQNTLSDFELMIEEKHARIAAEPLPVVPGIALQINQVFTNLISNALKFTKANPQIHISSRIVPFDQVINRPKILAENNYYEVAFADNGIGFEEQYEKQIFGMFQRLHARHEFSGTGIGLALCKKIMDNHGGHITGKSEYGKGSTFYVYFPVKNPA